MLDVDICVDVLEAGMYSAEHIIPPEVIESTLHYLKEYKRLSIESSWYNSVEDMGR